MRLKGLRAIAALLKTWSSEKEDGDFRSFPPVTGEFRQLAIGSAITRLSRLDIAMRKLGLLINVESMAQFNSPKYDAEWLVRRIIRPGDTFPYTRQEQIKFLVFGSPTSHYILTHVRDYLLPSMNFRAQKIIITEDTSAVGFFYERTPNHLHVDSKIATVKLSRKTES